jgi:hypothetical protein
MLNVIMLNVIMLNVIMLNVVMLNANMLNVVMLKGVMLIVFMLSVVAPWWTLAKEKIKFCGCGLKIIKVSDENFGRKKLRNKFF